jgi:ubiquinone/menaquinone biosynthesis C-methylase UbiE
MYFGPLHFLLVREIVRVLGAGIPKGAAILDLGCGTGVAGAAWAAELDPKPRVIGIDRNPWALEEARWTYRQFEVNGIGKSGDVASLRIPAATAVIAAFTINEIDESSRERLRGDFIRVARTGAPVLVIEPIARRLSAWWDDWAESWTKLGGRSDEWRFRVELPERLALMDRAAGLDHRELTGRSLWLPGGA